MLVRLVHGIAENKIETVSITRCPLTLVTNEKET